MSDLVKYYENEYSDIGYRLQNMLESSRVAFLVKYLQHYVKPGSRVLDVGCGDMYLSQLLPQYEWVGIDVDQKTCPKAIRQDLMSTPWSVQGPFDAVVCSEVLEHVWDLKKVHSEVKRLLKKTGIYVISTPNFDNIDHKLEDYRQVMFDPRLSHTFEHIRFYNYESHCKFLKDSGFEVLEHTGADAHYVKFFVRPRNVLLSVLNQQLGLNVNSTQVDMIVGQMFPERDHTIMIVSQS